MTMEMPKPGEAHQKLGRLVGTWSGGETLHPAPWDPVGGKADARIINRSILDGFAVVQEYEQRRGGAVSFRGHGVFWYDADKDEYVMTWWDSMAARANEYRGRFNGNVLELGSPMPQGGRSRASFDLAKQGRYGFLMDVSPDGQNWQPAMRGTYKKGPAPASAGAKSAAAPKRTVVKASPVRSAKPAPPKARKSVKKGAARSRRG